MGLTRERKTDGLEPKNKQTQTSSNTISDPNRAFKGLHTPDFSENRKRGAVVIDGEADSVLYMGQDARYGTALTGTSSAGDFSNKIVLAVGFLNEGKKDGDEIDVSNPDLRYGAGLTIYQRTDTGKDAIVDQANPKNKDRKATTLSPQKAVSVFEINADVVELKARNGGVNIIAGYDPTLPSYGDPSDRDRQNTEYVGVSLIGGGNPDEKILADKNDVRGLQPMVKGDNLEDRLREMSRRISDVNNVLLQVIKTQKVTDIALAFHTHAATFGLGPSVELGIALGAVKTPLDIFNILSNITAKYNQVALSVNMSSVSEGGFKSFYNKTN